MKKVLATAILDQIEAELNGQSRSSQDVKTQRTRPDVLELVYSEAAYVLSVKLADDGRFAYRFSRMPACELLDGEHRLTESGLFTKIANNVRAATRRDGILVRVLERVAARLLYSFRQMLTAPPGWDVAYYGPGLNKTTISVWAALRPRELRRTFPSVVYRLVLTADKHGNFEVSLYSDNVDPPLGSNKTSSFLWLTTPTEWRSRQWTAEELPRLTSLAVQRIEDFVLTRLLPVESADLPSGIRHAMLRSVPLRLAEAVRDQDEVARSRELVDAALVKLRGRAISRETLIRRAFLKRLQCELSDPDRGNDPCSVSAGTDLKQAWSLADLAWAICPPDAADVAAGDSVERAEILSDEDREMYGWFWERATLEQLIDLMTLS
jgi:hypothetical protein